MKQFSPLWTAAIFVAATMTPALAQQAQPASANASAPPAKVESKPAQDVKAVGEHEVVGTVTRINHTTGHLDLATKAATLKLHFSPAAIEHLKSGDRISVQLAYVNGLPPKATGTATDSKNEIGEHWMTGRITGINHRTGLMSLKTEEGTLRLSFPADSIRDLKRGNETSVQMSYSKTA